MAYYLVMLGSFKAIKDGVEGSPPNGGYAFFTCYKISSSYPKISSLAVLSIVNPFSPTSSATYLMYALSFTSYVAFVNSFNTTGALNQLSKFSSPYASLVVISGNVSSSGYFDL